jgi:hypothetical protein
VADKCACDTSCARRTGNFADVHAAKQWKGLRAQKGHDRVSEPPADVSGSHTKLMHGAGGCGSGRPAGRGLAKEVSVGHCFGCCVV